MKNLIYILIVGLELVTFCSANASNTDSEEYWKSEIGKCTKAAELLAQANQNYEARKMADALLGGGLYKSEGVGVGYRTFFIGTEAAKNLISHRIAVAEENLKKARSQTQIAIAAAEARAREESQKVGALLATVTELKRANELSEECSRQSEERARLAEERSRKQDARLEELMGLLRLVQAQMAPGPTSNSEVDGGSDNESQTSFAPSTTSNHWEKLKQHERNSK